MMEKVQSEKFDGELIPQRILLNIVGIWPKSTNYFSSFVRFLLATIINISCLCSLLVELYRQCTSVDDLMDAFSLSVSGTIAGLKLLVHRMKSNHSRVLVDSVIADWSAVKDAQTLMLQTLHLSVLIIVQCCGDSWFFSLTMHLCGQFKVLRINLEEIKFKEFDAHKKLGILVKRHCNLIRLTNNLKQSFSNIILLQLLSSILMICVDGFVFLASLDIGDNIGAFRAVAFIFTYVQLLLQLYLFAYAGNMLESEAESIAHAAYSSPWYLLSGHAAKDLTLIINRGQISCRATAGKFATTNHFTFKEALKASASYLSVLRVMMKTQ